jgi:hypothetical protein
MSQITYKKGWLRCKHGVLIRRGRVLINHCNQCSELAHYQPPPAIERPTDVLTPFYSSDKGVT